MQTNDFQKFHDGIVGVMGFYGRSVSSFALDVWWTALKGHDLAAIVDAFNRHLANPDAGQFPPKPADIIRILDLRRPIYSKTTCYGHFGRRIPEITWEQTDRAETLRKAFGA